MMKVYSDEKVCREYMEQMRWKGGRFAPIAMGKPYNL